jgi:hypothetical protein
LIPFLASQLNAQSLVPAEPCSKSSLSGRDAELSRTKLITVTTLPFKMPDRTSSQKNLGLDELSRLELSPAESPKLKVVTKVR